MSSTSTAAIGCWICRSEGSSRWPAGKSSATRPAVSSVLNVSAAAIHTSAISGVRTNTGTDRSWWRRVDAQILASSACSQCRGTSNPLKVRAKPAASPGSVPYQSSSRPWVSNNMNRRVGAWAAAESSNQRTRSSLVCSASRATRVDDQPRFTQPSFRSLAATIASAGMFASATWAQNPPPTTTGVRP